MGTNITSNSINHSIYNNNIGNINNISCKNKNRQRKKASSFYATRYKKNIFTILTSKIWRRALCNIGIILSFSFIEYLIFEKFYYFIGYIQNKLCICEKK